jgi:hypothetical protein
LAVPVLTYSFGIIKLAPRKTAKTGQENEVTANHPRAASHRGRRRSIICSQKTGRKGPDVVGGSLHSRIHKTG